jgi:hypothetical protein
MRWPADEDKDVVQSAQVTAAANVVVNERRNGRNTTLPLNVDQLCKALIADPVASSFEAIFQDEDPSIVEIVIFFMQCRDEVKPSLLRARHFIESGGFLPDEVMDKKEANSLKRSATTLKEIWRTQSASSAFVWAAHFYSDVENDVHILDLSPDGEESVKIAQAILEEMTELKRFFGVARYCQDKLHKLLGPAAVGSFRLLKLPKEVVPIEHELDPFDAKQMEIIRAYAVPQ